MSSPVIKVENLSKQYRLGQVGTGSLAHDINRIWHRTRGKGDPYLKIGEENNRESKGNSDYVWALKDINFDIEQGDRVGIIGRNGAGKSTLLKILSRTTSPTSGSVKIKGKVASLLEVGTGFHPDLSGRDNIFLNGAILGMSKRDIKNRFEEIVDFAGVERYIDTPVKRYSSGMYVRLAFAVAAHLESDILIVDEVLAVGDAEFQKKCLGKMGEVSVRQGKTILFVSHNMGAISQLCNNGILLNAGKIQSIGTIKSTTKAYSDLHHKKSKSEFTNLELDNKKSAQLLQIFIEGGNTRFHSEEIVIHIKGFINNYTPGMQIGVGCQDVNLIRIFTVLNELTPKNIKDGLLSCSLRLPAKLLTPSTYSFAVAIWNKNKQIYDLVEETCEMIIVDDGTEFSIYESVDTSYLMVNGKWEYNEDI